MEQIKKIREAMDAVWPAVRDGIAEMIERAGPKRLSSFHRRIAEQTIWELDRAGRLKTPEEQAVLDAALAWHQMFHSGGAQSFDDAEDALCEAVEDLQS